MNTVQSSSVPPAAAEYGGDEISALVLDPGFSCTRAGFAGEDSPKSVIPSYYGLVEPSSDGSDPKLLFGDDAVYNPMPGLDIKNPMAKDSTVDDWDAAKKLWEYAMTFCLAGSKTSATGVNSYHDGEDVQMEGVDDKIGEGEKPLDDSPLLMSEAGWNQSRAREKTIEIAMEDWGCPAFWLARSGVMAAFAAGKASALVIDVGASNLSVTPVHDGLILRKGIMRSHLAGNFVSQQARVLFSSSQPPIPLTPSFLVTAKAPVEAGAPASATYRTFAVPIRDSFRLLQEERVLTDFKESVVQVWGGPGRLSSGNQATTNEEVAKGLPGRPFEFPDGYNQVFGGERFRVAEGIFDAKMALTDAENPAPHASQTLPALIEASLNTVDVDVRTHLLGNVVVVGGSSLLYGFTDRLNWELSQMYPNQRVRISAAGNTAERKFASWIGGSILGSLGTFHQMWISKREYEEHGAGVVEKRCK